MASFMDLALEEAYAAGGRGEVPVGCVIAHNGSVVARAANPHSGNARMRGAVSMVRLSALRLPFFGGA